MRKWLVGVVGCGIVVMAAAAVAQTFGDDMSADGQQSFSAERFHPTEKQLSADEDKAERKTAAEPAEAGARQEAVRQRQVPASTRSVPAAAGVAPIDLPNVPTTDGSRRGNVSVNRILQPGEQPDENEDKELIFIYYKDFQVRRMAAGRVECDVKFVVLTSLNQKLSNLSIKLRWPKLTTSVVFLDVAPNIQVYHDYTLMGEGCYNMDKIPNIIVNRCRVKGLSQADCAKKIRWLKIS